MRIYSKILFFLVLFLSILNIANSSFISDLFDDNGPEVHYCQDDECGIDNGINEVGNNVDGIVTGQTASSYFQNVVKYLLGFIYLVAVALIIYAGANLMAGIGDEEKAKKSKTMIIYVVIGIAIIFLANSIVSFVVKVLESGN